MISYICFVLFVVIQCLELERSVATHWGIECRVDVRSLTHDRGASLDRYRFELSSAFQFQSSQLCIHAFWLGQLLVSIVYFDWVQGVFLSRGVVCPTRAILVVEQDRDTVAITVRKVLQGVVLLGYCTLGLGNVSLNRFECFLCNWPYRMLVMVISSKP